MSRDAATLPSIDRLVPHSGTMSLLDRVVDAGDDHVVAELAIRSDGVFNDAGGVDAWIGIEYMAQAVAAWAGLRAHDRGEAPKIGLLLGTRRYLCHVPRFAVGDRLRITAVRQFIADNGLGQFDCRIERDGSVVAEAALNVFEPDDANHLQPR